MRNNSKRKKWVVVVFILAALLIFVTAVELRLEHLEDREAATSRGTEKVILDSKVLDLWGYIFERGEMKDFIAEFVLMHQGESDQEKAFAIGEWVSHNITYTAQNGTDGKTAWDCFNARTGDCVGMTYISYLLASELGLECDMIRFVNLDEDGLGHYSLLVVEDGEEYFLDSATGSRSYIHAPKEKYLEAIAETERLVPVSGSIRE